MAERPAQSARKPSIRTIAKATGLSVATVSRVLNGAANVRRDTREQVIAAMREQGYSPNPAARALATRRTRTIAAVIPTLAHSIFARFLNAIEQELAQRGYALVIATTESRPEREHARARDLLDMGAEGLILSGASHAPELRELIARQNLPTVCTSIYDPACGLPTIGYDNAALGRDAIGYLLSLGHERIAVVHGPLADNDRTRLRLQGVREGADRSASLVEVETSLDVAGGSSAARQLLAQSARPTAALCLSDVLALGVLFEAARFQVRVPEQLSVMGFDDLDWAGFSRPALTTIKLPTARMGRAAARALVDFLDDQEPLTSSLLDAQIVIRESTAAAP